MDGAPVSELVKVTPSILWFIFAIVILFLFYQPLRTDLLPRPSGVKALGVAFALVRNSIDAAIDLAQKSTQWNVEVSRAEKERALNRAKQHLDIFRGAQILWVDDYPENNLNERRMLRRLKAETGTAKSTEDALDILSRGDYDLVISDMARGEKATTGLGFLKQFREEKS